MTKKSEKVRAKIKPSVPKQRKGGFNTIFLTIIFVLVSVILAFAAIVGLTIKTSINALYHSSIFGSLKKVDGFSQVLTKGNWENLMTVVNENINASERIVYYVVTEEDGVDAQGFPKYKVVAKSFDLKDEKKTDWYEYKDSKNINSFSFDVSDIAFNYNDRYGEKNLDKYMQMRYQYEFSKMYSFKHKVEALDKSYVIHLGFPDQKYADTDFGKAETVIWQCILILASIMLVVALFAAFILARSITLPLAIMTKTVSKIAKGDLSDRLEPTKYEELNHLVETYNMMANALQRLYSTLEAKVSDRTRELKSAYAELQNTQAMMVHSEKMKSLGELVAGIMHEINNPINFIYGNMTHLSNYSSDLISIIDEYEKYKDSLKPEEKESIEKYMEEVDYGFLKSDLPELIKSCKEGADRAKNIIQDLKSFSRMEEVAITDVDVPTEIDTTLNILHNKIKNKAQVHKEYMENVPKIEAFGGQLNQVFMNILDNAVGAIEKQGDIWIRINPDKTNKNLVIEIEDNGVGMDSETARKVFDPFFTTKPVGQGTGLGMSITHKIIKNHQGSINVESSKGTGTKFIITLPLNINRENLKTAALSEGENNG